MDGWIDNSLCASFSRFINVAIQFYFSRLSSPFSQSTTDASWSFLEICKRPSSFITHSSHSSFLFCLLRRENAVAEHRVSLLFPSTISFSHVLVFRPSLIRTTTDMKHSHRLQTTKRESSFHWLFSLPPPFVRMHETRQVQKDNRHSAIAGEYVQVWLEMCVVQSNLDLVVCPPPPLFFRD